MSLLRPVQLVLMYIGLLLQLLLMSRHLRNDPFFSLQLCVKLAQFLLDALQGDLVLGTYLVFERGALSRQLVSLLGEICCFHLEFEAISCRLLKLKVLGFKGID
jgi:hypothetical protein